MKNQLFLNTISLFNKVLGRPLATCQSHQPGKPTVFNVGNLTLTSHSPGDGWTRYQIVEITNEAGGQHNVSPVLSRAEMQAFLDGFETALRLV